MEIHCKALNHPIDRGGCEQAKKELPKKFCDGCEWLVAEKAVEPVPQHTKSSYTPSTYTIRISNKLRAKLIEKAKKQNVQPREYIVKFLADKLLE